MSGQFKKLIFAFILVTPLFAFGCSGGSDGLCANEIKREIASPDKMFKAVIFERGCGATTGFSAQISILPVGASLSNNDTGNVFIINQGYSEESNANGKRANLEVKWFDEKQLIVSFDDVSGTKPTRMKQQFERVKIIYDKRRLENAQQIN